MSRHFIPGIEYLEQREVLDTSLPHAPSLAPLVLAAKAAQTGASQGLTVSPPQTRSLTTPALPSQPGPSPTGGSQGTAAVQGSAVCSPPADPVMSGPPTDPSSGAQPTDPSSSSLDDSSSAADSQVSLGTQTPSPSPEDSAPPTSPVASPDVLPIIYTGQLQGSPLVLAPGVPQALTGPAVPAGNAGPATTLALGHGVRQDSPPGQIPQEKLVPGEVGKASSDPNGTALPALPTWSAGREFRALAEAGPDPAVQPGLVFENGIPPAVPTGPSTPEQGATAAFGEADNRSPVGDGFWAALATGLSLLPALGSRNHGGDLPPAEKALAADAVFQQGGRVAGDAFSSESAKSAFGAEAGQRVLVAFWGGAPGGAQSQQSGRAPGPAQAEDASDGVSLPPLYLGVLWLRTGREPVDPEAEGYWFLCAYAEHAIRNAERRVGPLRDHEDIVQQICVEWLEQAGPPKEAFPQLLARAEAEMQLLRGTVNRVIARVAYQQRKRLLIGDFTDWEAPSRPAELDWVEFKSDCEKGVGSLTRQEWEVLELRRQGMTFGDIGSQMGMLKQRVCEIYHAVETRLRKIYADHGG